MAKTETKVAPTGIRVSQLAKEFGIPSKVLIEKAKGLKIVVKNASSTLRRGQADRLRAKFGGGEVLRAALEKKKKSAKKKAPAKKAAVRKTTPAKAGRTEAPLQAPDEAPVPEVAPAETVTPVPAEAALSEAPAAVVVEGNEPPDAGTVEAPPTPTPAPTPKIITAGPKIAPPAPPKPTEADPRFGIVLSAEKAKEVHGEEPPQEKRGRGAQVEAKAVSDFKAQVSYPKLPEVAFTEEARTVGRGRRRGPVRRLPGRRQKRRGQALMQDSDRTRMRKKNRPSRAAAAKPTVVRTGPAEVTSPVTIKNLCNGLGIKSSILITKFLKEGKSVRINDILSNEDAVLYASEFDPLGFGIKIKKARDVEDELLRRVAKEDKPENLLPRAPVVTVMGHVDHGKTSLLDYVRKAHVAKGEAGGITQHIKAYKVPTPKSDVAFLDTPGHRAFTKMRARGANVTDIVVLVVAADDGVMPQTEEAIHHAQAAKKRMVVAINKIDLPEANIEKVKGELAGQNVVVEDYGGECGCVPVSAKTGQGIDELLERIALEAEILELKANPEKAALGTVIEAHKDPGRGIVATLLVQEGTLRSGDNFICGHAYGTVRQLLDDRGRAIEAAGPSSPVLVTGLNDVPLAGERFFVLQEIKMAAEIAGKRARALRQEGLSIRQRVTLESLHELLEKGEVASLKLILKVDVMGSLQPVEQAITELSTEEAKIEVLHSAVGTINETDVHLADASNAIIIGFHISTDPGARRLAEMRGVEVRSYDVIYEVVDEMRKALEGLLKPIEKEVIQGRLEIRQTFKVSRLGRIAGCFVSNGFINRNSSVRLLRDGKPLWSGKLASLRRVKDDVREVREGFECGVRLEGYDDIKQGDAIEAFTIEQVARTLESTAGKK